MPRSAGNLATNNISDSTAMLEAQLNGHTNLVSWTFSGEYDPNTPVLLDAEDPSRCVTRKQAEEQVSRFVESNAFKPGSTVCLHLANDVTYPILVLGILASGCRWTGTNPVYTPHELAHHFRASQTKYVITAFGHFETVLEAVSNMEEADPDMDIEIIIFTDMLKPDPPALQLFTYKGEDFRIVRNLMRSANVARLHRHLNSIHGDDIAAMMSTSGTTGFPKMAARTHRAMMLETAAIQDENAKKSYPIRRLMSTPIFHAFTTPEVIFNPLRLGYPTYIMKRFHGSFAQKVHDLGITETAAAPPALKKLADTSADHHLLQGLKHIFCGGAPLAPAERERFLNIFEKEAPRIVQVWGMTEGGWFTTFKYPENDSTGSVGRPIPGYKVRVLPNDTVTLEHGQPVGELLVKGPQLMSHYYGNEAATAQTFTQNGWLETGDIGYVSEDGKVYIIDRIKDLIKVNAFQVAPAELEEALLQSPLVRDAGACAAGHGNDEHPALFVVPRDAAVTEAAVKACLTGRLASYKVKSAQVIFVDNIPKSPTGKILRKELRKMIDEIAQQQAKGQATGGAEISQV